MKKLSFLIIAALAVSAVAFGQLQSNKSAAKLGYQGALDIEGGDKKFSLNFNSSSTTLPYGGIANDGKGVLSVVLSSEAPVGKVSPLNNKKADNWGGNCNVYKYPSVADLLNFTVVDTLKAYNKVHQYWKPTNVIVQYNGDTADHVLAAYPGMYKRVSLGFQVSIDGGGLKSDISFEVMTADLGNTGKQSSYKMIVSVGKESKFGSNPFSTVAAIDTASAANVASYRAAFGSDNLWIIDDVYTSDTITFAKKTIKIAEAIGVQPGTFNGKKVYVTLYSKGTGTNVEPGIYDPVIAIDNLEGVYGPVSWIAPEGVVGNSVVNHNNGSPVLTTSADFSGGDPVLVNAMVQDTVKFYLTDKNRASSLSITEGNDGGGTNPKFTFPAEGAVKAMGPDGKYSVELPYTFTPSDGSSKFNLVIPAPEVGVMVNDTLEIAILVDQVPIDGMSVERLEISNGVRFWYNIGVKGLSPNSSVAPNANSVTAVGVNNTLYVRNASEEVKVYNTAGQLLKSVSAQAANKGVALPDGVYIVKTGKNTIKALVK